jgi:hypothetical protein
MVNATLQSARGSPTEVFPEYSRGILCDRSRWRCGSRTFAVNADAARAFYLYLQRSRIACNRAWVRQRLMCQMVQQCHT